MRQAFAVGVGGVVPWNSDRLLKVDVTPCLSVGTSWEAPHGEALLSRHSHRLGIQPRERQGRRLTVVTGYRGVNVRSGALGGRHHNDEGMKIGKLCRIPPPGLSSITHAGTRSCL